jgi:prepilin-type N-terminal cleavage/methylation domain-containing protein
MKSKHETSKGFTLIELMVVIAIIGLLSSVILVSLKTAKNKARDAAVLTSIQQFKTLFALDYSNTGNYANLQPDDYGAIRGYLTEVTSLAECTSKDFRGEYANQARTLCQNILRNGATYFSVGYESNYYNGQNNANYGAGETGTEDKYVIYWSLRVRMPSTNLVYCISSLNRSSKNVSTDPYGFGGLYSTSPGCWSDPAI